MQEFKVYKNGKYSYKENLRIKAKAVFEKIDIIFEEHRLPK